MKVEIKVPPLGESVVEATIGTLLKPSGSSVKQDEEILELETDKVNQVLYAPSAGTIQINVKVGDTVKVGQVIGFVDSAAAQSAPTAPKPESKPESKPEPKPAPKQESKSEPKPEPKKESPPPPSSAPVRKMGDQFLAELKESPKPLAAPIVQQGNTSRQKMSKLRKVIAQKLVEVKNQTAMLTTFNEVDMSAIIAVREKEQESFQKKHGVKLGFMSFFAKACAHALEEYPSINARIEGDEIVFHNYINISIAVSTDKGLMVPVLRNVEKMSYAEIEIQLKAFSEKARAGTIAVDDLQGGTFTITNGGTFGSLLSTPILNPPQSGILGMHNIVKRPVALNDQVVIRPMMYIALSYDHRIVDGKESIGFLVNIKKNLEEPTRLLLDL